jgi:Peroxisomal biogenesis factor 11 (PEX11)
LEREVALIAELQRRRRARAAYGSPSAASGEDDEKDDALLSEIRQLRARRALRTLGLAQDLADALLAFADLRGDSRAGSGVLSSKAVLAIAGLVSGCISAYKNWPGNVV